MASKALATIALLVSINLLFLAMANAHSQPKCPKDALVLDVCANILNVVDVSLGKPHGKCCSLIKGLADLEMDACLCTVVKANILGLKMKAPLQLSALLSKCGMKRRAYRCN